MSRVGKYHAASDSCEAGVEHRKFSSSNLSRVIRAVVSRADTSGQIVKPDCITGTQRNGSPQVGLISGNQNYHSFVREAFKQFAGRWGIETWENVDKALHCMRTRKLEALLLDVNTNDPPTEARIAKLKALFPDLPMVVLGARCGGNGVLLALMAGAIGYLVKPLAGKRLVAAIRVVAQGSPTFCKSAEKDLVTSLHRVGGLVSAGFSPREREIIQCLMQHLSDKQISQQLGIAPNTVHVHLFRLYKKLGSHSREETVRNLCSP